MLSQRKDQTFLREKALGEGLGDVASELRLVDVVDLVAFIRNEQFANVGDLVNSAVERFFKPDTLRYGQAADVELQWGNEPAVSIDMEFHHRSISVYFRLLLESFRAGVEINYITFGIPGRDPALNTERLVDAITDARLLPLPAAPAARPSAQAAVHL